MVLQLAADITLEISGPCEEGWTTQITMAHVSAKDRQALTCRRAIAALIDGSPGTESRNRISAIVLTEKLSDTGGPASPNWQLAWPTAFHRVIFGAIRYYYSRREACSSSSLFPHEFGWIDCKCSHGGNGGRGNAQQDHRKHRADHDHWILRIRLIHNVCE